MKYERWRRERERNGEQKTRCNAKRERVETYGQILKLINAIEFALTFLAVRELLVSDSARRGRSRGRSDASRHAER